MYKMKYILGINPTDYDNSIKGAAETICNIRNELSEMIQQSKKTNKELFAKITVEYGTEKEWELNRKKFFEIYEPIKDPIGPEHESSIIFLMSLGLTEEQAKQKIKNGWKFPTDEKE